MKKCGGQIGVFSMKHVCMFENRGPERIDMLPVKRTVKKYKVFPASSLCAAGRFLCSEIQLVLLHRRQHAQVALYSPGVVVVDIVLNHLDKFFLTGKSSAVVTLPL